MICKVNRSPKYRILVDQRQAASALTNQFGWPQNEISLLLKLNADGKMDSPLAQSMLNCLNSLPTPKVDNSGKSEKEILSAVIPKYCQTLGEYMKYLDTLPLSSRERKFMEESAKEHFSSDDTLESVEPEDVKVP